MGKPQTPKITDKKVLIYGIIKIERGVKMSLMKCPECQNEISTQAITCPKCGYPIKEALDNYAKSIISNEEDSTLSLNKTGEVTIEIDGGFVGKIKIYDMETKDILWTGKSLQTATVNVADKKLIGITWGLGGFSKASKYTVEEGKKYKLTWKAVPTTMGTPVNVPTFIEIF